MEKAILVAWLAWAWFGIYLLYCCYEEFKSLYEDFVFWFVVVGMICSECAVFYFVESGVNSLNWPLTVVETIIVLICSFVRIGFVYRIITYKSRMHKYAKAMRMQREEEERQTAAAEGRHLHLGYIDGLEDDTAPWYGQKTAMFGSWAQIITWLILAIFIISMLYYKDYVRIVVFSTLYIAIDFIWRFVMNGAQWKMTLYSYEGDFSPLNLAIPTYNFILCLVWQILSIIFLWITIYAEPADLLLKKVGQFI